MRCSRVIAWALALLCAACSGYRHVQTGEVADDRWQEEPARAADAGSP